MSDPLPPSRAPAPVVPPVAPAPPRARRGRPEKPGRGRRALVLFLLANLIPAAVIVWFATMPAERRQAFLDRVPSGVGGRALAAGVAFAVLLVLARLVLPAARAALAFLGNAMAWFRTRPRGKRALLYPAEAATSLTWFGVQVLFAIDAALILAAAAAFLMYVVRIVKPDWFPFLPG
jgi:hypothetical protein